MPLLVGVTASHGAPLTGSADEQVLFPMYTGRLEAVLQMTTVEPHEVLKLQKLLVEFETWREWTSIGTVCIDDLADSKLIDYK